MENITESEWTKRDEIALKVFLQYITNENDAPDGEDYDEWHSKMAYDTADAFLKIRLETKS